MGSGSDWGSLVERAFGQQIQLDQTESAAQEKHDLANDARRFREIKSSRGYGPLLALVRARATLRPKSKRRRSDDTTTSQETEARRLSALTSRIETVLTEFHAEGGAASASATPIADLADALDRLTQLITVSPQDRSLLWLTHIAINARYPAEEAMRRFDSDIAVYGARSAIEQLLLAHGRQRPTWSLYSELELVRSVVVDASVTSRRSFHTGIQRVVRGVVPRWCAAHDVRLISWTQDTRCFRQPSPSETHHVLSFDPGSELPDGLEKHFDESRILVPWRTVVIVPEVLKDRERAEALACLATWSGSELGVVIHDFLVYSMPECFGDSTRVSFGSSFHVIRSAHRVSTTSEAVTHDFHDFSSLFERLKMTPPEIRIQGLPVSRTDVSPKQEADARSQLLASSDLPIVLSVGSIEPRKNQLTTLRAAEILWQEGLNFQLIFVAWQTWGTEWFYDEIERLQARGRPVRVITKASEDLLWTAYRSAAFSVYISFAEGFGLPPAESIASGTPVILSNVGSMIEVARSGGAVLVNPADLQNVAAAMRELLSNPEKAAVLRRQIEDVQGKSWDTYARETWDWLVEAKSDPAP